MTPRILSLCALVYLCIALTDAYVKHTIDWNGNMKECYGTFNGMSMSGDSQFRYRELRARYSGCTRVLGNLEIVFLEDTETAPNYDMSFLSEIREVTGYIIIVGNIVREIPLLSLEAIRGAQLFLYTKQKINMALTVALNYKKTRPNVGLNLLSMPRLREIQRGGVLIENNTNLCYIDSINWDMYERARPEADTIMNNRMGCRPGCAKECYNSTTKMSHCWATGADNCQTFQPGRPAPPPIVPSECESKVKQVCTNLAKQFSQTVSSLSKSLKEVSKKARKLKRALTGQKRPQVASGRAD